MSRFNKEAKLLYKVYKEFYGKEPNFSKDNFRNITIEIQSMAYILNEYGVSLGSNGFVKEGYVDWDLPMSMDIQDVIVGQLNGNNENMIDDSIEFPEDAKKKIEIISREIRSAMNDTSDPIESLRLISYILFIKTRAIPCGNESAILKEANCELADLENEEKVINAINAEIYKENIDESDTEIARKGETSNGNNCEDVSEKQISEKSSILGKRINP